jgi:ribosomal protein S18 acetylase RimI-like enzyme
MSKIRPYQLSDSEAVIALWRLCGLTTPQNDPAQDIARKVADSPELFLVAELEGKLVGTVMAGYDGHRGWINYLAVAPGLQKKGIGLQLMGAAEARLKDLGCPKVNLQVRKSNSQAHAFYEKIGYKEDQVSSFGKRLSS